MDLDELTALIHDVDRKKGGCTVEFSTYNHPAHKQGSMFGIVTYGHEDNERVFHNADELRAILERNAK